MNVKLDGLQACRGAAALLVLLYHNAITYFPICIGTYDLATQVRSGGPNPFDFGHAGVDFFFVLSGFVILWIHGTDIGRPDRFRRYLWRRVTRIYPTYWVVLALLLPIYFLRPEMGGGYEREPLVILKSVLLLPQTHFPIVPPAWALSHEMLFYALFSVSILSRKMGTILFGVWLLMIAYIAVDPSGFPWKFFGRQQNFEFFLGMAAAWYVRHRTVRAPLGVAALGVVIFVAFGLAEIYTAFPARQWEALGYGLGSMLVILGVVGAERAGDLRIPSLLRLLGDASYSIYLVHMPLLSVMARGLRATGLHFGEGNWLLFILMAGLACAGGVLFHVVVERPLMDLVRRRAAGRHPEAAPSG